MILSPSSEKVDVPPMFDRHSPSVIAVFHLSMNQTVDISSRSVYNIFDVVSEWGGVQGSLLLLGSTFSALFSSILGSIQKAEALYQVSSEDY